MVSKYKVLLCIAICLSYEVVMTCCEVVWVNRNIIDSFRVGKNGCNESVCNMANAMCQGDGSCLCNSSAPNFRNPSFREQSATSSMVSTDTYECLDSNLVRYSEGSFSVPYCSFGPFKVIPHSPKDPAEQFEYNPRFKNCTFIKTLVKFPDNATEMEQPWLNESYVNLTRINTKLHLKWKRSVQVLQGTIITFILQCFPPAQHLKWECLRAKVLGTWRADINSTSPSTIQTDNQRVQSATSSATINSTSPSTIPTDNQRVATSSASIPPSQGETGNKQNSVDSDSDPDLKIILIATVVPVVFLVILIVVVCFLCKHKKGTRKRNISKKGSTENRDSWGPKQFRHTDSCLRGADAYVNLPGMDTAQTFGAEKNPGYRTSDDQRVATQEKTVYATPDTCRKRDKNGENLHKEPGYEPVEVKKKQTKDSSFHEVPGYETPDLERKETKRANSHEVPGYETPDIERRANNDGTEDSAYATPDRDTGKEEHVDSGASTTDIKRVEVNGDLYALPDKKTRKINGLSYMDPSYLASGSQEKPAESDDQVGQPTEYADIVGVVKEKKKKKK